jgi:ABC-2 type transport system permease protein
MNLRGGWELIKRSHLGWLAGRGFYWTLTFGWMVPSLLYLFVWATVAGQGEVQGFNRDGFIVYYLCFIMLNQFTYPVCNWTVGDNIRIGNFSTWLLQPMPPIFEAITTDIAMKVVCTPFAVLVTVVLLIFLHPALPFSLWSCLYFLPALLLAQILRFLMAYTLALLALWNSRSDALLALNDTLVFLLAGEVAPIALLPGWLGTLATALPFRSMLGFPVEVLVGRLSTAEIWQGLALQSAWVLAVILLYRLVWHQGLRHYASVGG